MRRKYKFSIFLKYPVSTVLFQPLLDICIMLCGLVILELTTKTCECCQQNGLAKLAKMVISTFTKE